MDWSGFQRGLIRPPRRVQLPPPRLNGLEVLGRHATVVRWRSGFESRLDLLKPDVGAPTGRRGAGPDAQRAGPRSWGRMYHGGEAAAHAAWGGFDSHRLHCTTLSEGSRIPVRRAALLRRITSR